MKENTNNLTALLIVISIATLSYLNINKEKVEIDVKVTEQIVEKEIEIETEETVVAKIPTISQVVISGKITNSLNREARFFTRDTSITTYVDWIGRFNLTFPLDSSGYLTFHHGMETTAMYCNPDDTIYITINTKEFDETITYTGSEECSFLAWKFLHQENSTSPDVYNSTTEELNEQLDNLINPMIERLKKGTKFYNSEINRFKMMKEYYIKRHTALQNLPKVGEAAIDFIYPDMNGNMVSLSDFKGSYVYVDIWATWCGPCKYEIPFLKQLEKDYHDANIIFMSVSIDVEKAKQKWIDMINEKNMGGVQLISINGWKSQICKDYAINGIPRFMLFDREGNVISVDAVRPSSDEIREIFNGFGNIEEEEEEEVVDL